MSRPSAASVLATGLATSIGSLPHIEPRDAAEVVLRCHPALPAAPQLPMRTPLEGMVAQWARALPEVMVTADGSLRLDEAVCDGEPLAAFDPRAHAGLLTFLDVVGERTERPRRVKVQVSGPLTLGMALRDAGMPVPRAFERAAGAARAWAIAVEELVAQRLPGAQALLVFDEPALVAWRNADAPLERDSAIDLLSGVLAAPSCVTGVHVCGSGDRRLAFEVGPKVLAVEVLPDLTDDADMLARHLDADGWVAWGAVPTDQPVGESAEPLWRRFVGVWCELTKRGCDPARLRTQALVTPACGLAGHGPTQAERALRLTRELADRLRDQSVAARLAVGV